MSHTLLVVDDQPSLLRLFDTLLAVDDRFAEAVTASTAEAACLAAAACDPDAVLLDADLGTSDGLMLIPQLRKLAPRALIVVFSSAPYASPEIARAAGGDLFVAKGTDPEDLLDLLDRQIRARASRQQDEVRGGVDLNEPEALRREA